ncbi:MAG: hypothetical protein J1F03_05370 [Oscillospiraceae bacterium]|nr:hypothetical protein [Oscillospiraceae bacterium]
MKKFIAYISAFVLIIFLAAVSAIIFLSFTISALVVTVASGDYLKGPSEANDKLSAEITSYAVEYPEPTDNNTINTQYEFFEISL